MPGPSIPWKTLETEAWRTQIDSVPPARYKLASPRTITGSPSFAMESADQHCVVRVYIGAGEAPDLSLTVSGTTPVPMTNAVGGNLTAQELADLRIEVGMPQPGFALLTTDEPNGSPSAPFTTEAERTAWATANLATLLPGRTTAWGPGNVESVWNGPLATDWQGIRGPYLGSASNPFPNAAALPSPTSLPVGQYWCAKLAGPGVMKMQNFGGVWRPEMNSFTIYEGVDNFSVVSSGSTSSVILPLFTIPADFIKDLDTYRIRFCYFADAANSGADGVGVMVGGVEVASLTVTAGQNIWADGDLNRVSGALRRVRFLTSAGGSTSPAIMNVDLSAAQVVSARITPADGANKTYLRRISMERA